jgi:hypothetical protein
MLPEDFRCLSFGWTRDPMNDALLTPSNHDGMAAFAAGQGKVYLVRNHEVGDGPDAFAPNLAYDPKAGGGTTTLEFDTNRGLLLSSWSMHRWCITSMASRMSGGRASRPASMPRLFG